MADLTEQQIACNTQLNNCRIKRSNVLVKGGYKTTTTSQQMPVAGKVISIMSTATIELQMVSRSG